MKVLKISVKNLVVRFLLKKVVKILVVKDKGVKNIGQKCFIL